MKSAKGLVEFAEKAYKEKWGYCLGAYGNILTPAFLRQKQAQGGGVGDYNTKHNAYLQKFLNKRVSDCYGLIKGYVWWVSNSANPKYVIKEDRNQEGAYSAAKEKGTLASLPEIPGIILWRRGHAGIYIGGGEFIEIVGAPVGMRKGRIVNGKVTSGSLFTHWFKDTYIDYSQAKPIEKPVYSGNSIVDYLSSIGVNPSFANRAKLAKEYGISLYIGTATQNLKLLELMRGQAKPVAKVAKVGGKLVIKDSAGKYAGTSVVIPKSRKNKVYTIQQLGTGTKKDRVLVKEVYSWVYLNDVELL